ncbi:MAG: response regulator [Thalassotalea sp.]
MKHILLVEDDLRLAQLIEQFLLKNEFKVTVLNSGEKAVDTILKKQPDLVLLDVMLPGQNGFSICRAIRDKFTNPILFLTAKDSDFDHVLGLEIGADDYLIKPVEPHVLLARINMILRRFTYHKPSQVDELVIGQLKILKRLRQVYLQDQLVELTSHEFDLLWLLASNADDIQHRESIHQQLLGREYDGFDRSVDVKISRLRKKLGDDSNNPFKIITVWGKGYLFSSAAWNS